MKKEWLFRRYIKRNDIIILIFLLVFAISLLIYNVLSFKQTTGAFLRITQNGVVTGVYALVENKTIQIDNEFGKNEIVIYGGHASIHSADCRDQICVRSHKISKIGERIVCLPHKLILSIVGKRDGLDGDVDAIAE